MRKLLMIVAAPVVPVIACLALVGTGLGSSGVALLIAAVVAAIVAAVVVHRDVTTPLAAAARGLAATDSDERCGAVVDVAGLARMVLADRDERHTRTVAGPQLPVAAADALRAIGGGRPADRRRRPGGAGQLRRITAGADAKAEPSPIERDDPLVSLRGVALDHIPRVLADTLGVDCAVILEFRDGRAVPVASHLPQGQHLDAFVPERSGSVATVFRTGAPARIDDDERLGADTVAPVARAGRYRSSVAVPIIVDDRAWGAVLAATTGHTPLPTSAEGLLTSCAAVVASLRDEVELPGAAAIA